VNPSDPPVVATADTREALELPRLLALVAAEARTDLGGARVAALVPAPSRADLERRRAAYEEVDRLAAQAPLVPSLEAPPLAPLAERLATSRPPLDGPEILVLARVLRAAGEAAQRIGAAEPPCPELARRLVGLEDPGPLVRRIEKVLDARGQVRDDASPRLVELRRSVQQARERIYRRLESIAGESPEMLGEETVPLRGGRLMLVVQPSARGRRQGLVHGRSASGKSLYFEPIEVVEENNTLQSAVEDQEAERRRLLGELLDALGAERPLVERLLALTAELDALEAARRFARVAGARLPELAPAGRFRLVGARHPLLDPRLAGLRRRTLGASGHEGEVVPLDLELGGERRVLVVTGPNAGGKTVALKCAGLLALAAQSGLPVPVEPGSELPFFATVVATVGDEQDLLADRSTFSGRLARLGEAWEAAGPENLALLDELGSGTDPEEGAALARALVEEVVARGGLGLVTTHLAALAAAAMETPGAACAAMEFEPASGRPTFRLRPGAPGGSEALALARRLGLSRAWIVRAEALLGPEHRDLTRLLAEVEATRQRLAADAAEAREEAAAARLAAARLDRERAALEAERRSVGRRLREELDEFRLRVKRDLTGELARLRAEFAAGKRRAAADEAARRLLAGAPELESEAALEVAGELEVGGRVRHAGLGWAGVLERLDGDRASVRVGGKRLTAGADELVPLGDAPKRRAQSTASATIASEAAAPELQLIGMRVEEALEVLDGWLDRTLAGGAREARVVHGHGTGRLRAAVREHLQRHPAVAGHRSGAPNEGGNGATVVTLKG